MANAFLCIRSLWRPSRLLRRGQPYPSWKAISLLFESISGSKRGNFPSKQERVPHTLHRISKITEAASNRRRVGLLDAATEKAFTIIADLKAKSCAPCGKRIYQMVSNRLIEVEGCIWFVHVSYAMCSSCYNYCWVLKGKEAKPQHGLIYVGIWISSPEGSL